MAGNQRGYPPKVPLISRVVAVSTWGMGHTHFVGDPYLDALAPKPRLKYYRLPSIVGKVREPPRWENLEEGMELGALLNNLVELRTAGQITILGLVYPFTGDQVVFGLAKSLRKLIWAYTGNSTF